MSILHIVASFPNGEIVSFGNAEPRSLQDGCRALVHWIPHSAHCRPDPTIHKIDWDTEELVDKTPDEQAFALLPKRFELATEIARELLATDQHMVSDRPGSRSKRSQWKKYRQVLRDLSKTHAALGRVMTPSEMVHEWPVRPDGVDAVPHLRKRLQDQK